jgi:MFS family permease
MKLARNRSLWIIGIAESVSGIGNWITMLAVFAIVVFRGHGTIVQSSGIFLAGLLPTLLFSPVAGWLCDRFDRKRLMIASELLDGLVVAGLIFVRRLELLYALLALQAVVMSVMAPARQAVIPDLVDNTELTRANAFLQQLAGIIKIAGPVLAGLVLAVISPHSAFILDVISFILSAVILTRLPALPPHPQRASVLSTGTAGTGEAAKPSSAGRTVLRFPQLRLLFASTFCAIFIIVGFDVLSSVVTRDVLDGNEKLFSLLIGAVGLGTTVVAVMMFLDKGERDPWRDVLWGLALLACLPASVAAAAALGTPAGGRLALAAGCLVGGVGNGLVNVQITTLLQRLSPPALLGQVSGLFQSTAVAGQLAGIVVTPLIVPALLAIGSYFLAGTVGLLLLVGVAVVLLRRTPSSPEPAPVPLEQEQ